MKNKAQAIDVLLLTQAEDIYSMMGHDAPSIVQPTFQPVHVRYATKPHGCLIVRCAKHAWRFMRRKLQEREYERRRNRILGEAPPQRACPVYMCEPTLRIP
jgi:hypothetical protein